MMCSQHLCLHTNLHELWNSCGTTNINACTSKISTDIVAASFHGDGEALESRLTEILQIIMRGKKKKSSTVQRHWYG